MLENISHSELSTFEIERYIYETKIASKREKRHEGDKINVLYQTDFLEETFRDYIYNEIDIELILNRLKSWYLNFIDNLDNINWDWIIYTTQTNNLEDVIEMFSDRMSDEIYWKTIGICYISSDLGNSSTSVISSYLNCEREGKHFMMDEDERKYLENLPERFTVYRGCSKEEIQSKNLRFSWTLNKDVAEFFAFKNQPFLSQKDLSNFEIIERTIHKSEVVAYFNGRNEQEIIYFPKD